MQSKRITHITFDFFGTLVAYASGISSGVQYPHAYAFFVEKGLILSYGKFVSLYEKTYVQLTKNEKMDEFHMYDMVREFSKKLGILLTETELQTVTHIFLDEWNEIVCQIDDITSLLERLYARYTLAIISNTNFADMVQRNLKTMQTAHLFSLVVTSVEHGKRKPHRKIFEDTVKRLQTTPEHVLHVGDNYTDDYLGAKNAGMGALLIDEKGEYTEIVSERIASLFDIEKYLEIV